MKPDTVEAYPDEVEKLAAAHQEWADRCDALTTAIVIRNYRSDLAREFSVHGLLRRLDMLNHCMERVFESVPADEPSPSRDALMDATAFIQTFMINVYGAVDNLAHLWCAERGISDENGMPLQRNWIGLRRKNKVVRNSLPYELQAQLATHDAWFEYLENYRDSLAHRIPLYIPPGIVSTTDQDRYTAIEVERGEAATQGDSHRFDELNAMQRQLCTFRPCIMHSFGEDAKPVAFHHQMICDLATVVEIGERLFHSLDAAE